MSHYQGDDAEYIADEYEMKNVDDEMDEELHNKEMGLDSDVDEYDHMNNKVADTSAAQARRGKDIQGIPWDRLSTTREKYRQTRLEQYKNYENIPYSGEDSGKDCKASKKGGLYYEFRSNSRSVKPTVFHFQHTSVSPDGKLIIIVGDNPDGMLVDSSTGKTVMPLCGHLDFSFASAWHPDGVTFATGNQDKTSQIWDARNLSKSVAVLKGNLGAIRSIHYTSDGQYMAMAEPADFVHVYDVKNGYEKEQEINFFGEISGVSFSPDTEALYVGVCDRTYGSLLELSRCQNYS